MTAAAEGMTAAEKEGRTRQQHPTHRATRVAVWKGPRISTDEPDPGGWAKRLQPPLAPLKPLSPNLWLHSSRPFGHSTRQHRHRSGMKEGQKRSLGVAAAVTREKQTRHLTGSMQSRGGARPDGAVTRGSRRRRHGCERGTLAMQPWRWPAGHPAADRIARDHAAAGRTCSLGGVRVRGE